MHLPYKASQFPLGSVWLYTSIPDRDVFVEEYIFAVVTESGGCLCLLDGDVQDCDEGVLFSFPGSLIDRCKRLA